jgi:uncharacterized membrane protein YhhN
MSLSPSALGLAALLFGLASIAARYGLPRRPWLFCVLKPITTSLILGVAFIPASKDWHLYGLAIVAGLLFSIFGDILLVLPNDHFLAGLGSFLLAHVSYIVAFAGTTRYAGYPWIAIPLVLFGGFTLAYLWPAVPSRLRWPVAAYVLVIVTMASYAVYRAVTIPVVGAMLAAAGAVLFLGSDAVLAIERFRRPFRAAQAIVLVTYFAGQLLIALSAAA